MTNKELRSKIYSWLFDNFEIKYSEIDKSQSNSLKEILAEYSPTQLPAPKTNKIPKVAPEKKEYLDTKGPIKVWRNF
jgi:hypothetical protein